MPTEAIERSNNRSIKERFAHLTPEEKADLLEELLADAWRRGAPRRLLKEHQDRLTT